MVLVSLPMASVPGSESAQCCIPVTDSGKVSAKSMQLALADLDFTERSQSLGKVRACQLLSVQELGINWTGS